MQPEHRRIGYLLPKLIPLGIVVVIAACGWLLAKLLVIITGNLCLDVILGLLIILPPIVFIGYLFSLHQLSSRAASLRENGRLKYWVPPSLFLVTLAGVIYWLVYVVEQRGETAVIAIIAAITIGVLFPWLLPTVWIAIERTWWRILLGGSPIAPKLINDTLVDFELSISAREIDRKIPRPFAFLIALNARIFNFQELHHGLIREKHQKEKSLFKSTVDNLNEGWRSGLPPAIIDAYTEFIEDTSASIDDDDYREGLRGRCAVANVKYLLGKLKEARERAEDNWKEAGDDFVLKWMASYAYFSTRLFWLSRNSRESLNILWSHHVGPNSL